MSQQLDSYYEEKVFPLVKEGKDRFNWWAGLLGFYWFPYKGLWKEWLIYEVLLSFPLSFLMVLEHPAYPNTSLALKVLTAFFCGLVIVFLGNMSNSFYLKSYPRIQKKNVILRGSLGAIIATAVSFPIGMFAEKFAKLIVTSFL